MGGARAHRFDVERQDVNTNTRSVVEERSEYGSVMGTEVLGGKIVLVEAYYGAPGTDRIAEDVKMRVGMIV